MTPFLYPIPPVIGVALYHNDAVVVRAAGTGKGVKATRSEVKEFSRASRQRLAFVASNTGVTFTSLITLTYPRDFPNDGKDVKRNLNAFLTALRRKTANLEYLWFLEFQKRGAPHIHILARGIRVHRPMQTWTSSTWYRICSTEDERHLRAGTRLECIRKPDGARHYAVKYAFKMKQKVVPSDYRNVGRFWGHSKGVKPAARGVLWCTNDELVAVLAMAGWRWQRGDVVRWRTLYGASVPLTLWVKAAKLELSSSGLTDSEASLDERGNA